MLQLHAHPASTCSRRVLIGLHEKRIPFQLNVIALQHGEHKRPGFLKLNPYGRVPVLTDGDFVLYESASILTYLEALHPDPPLLPQAARDRARVDMHMRLCDAQFARHTGAITVPKRLMPRAAWPLDAMAAARAELQSHLQRLEPELQGRQYLVAEQFSLADLCYLPFVDLVPMMELDPPPAVAAWIQRLVSRPSAIANPLAEPPAPA